MFFSLFSQLCFLRHFYQNWVWSLPLVVVSMFVRLERYDPDWWRFFLEIWCWSRFWCGFWWLCQRTRLSLLEELNERFAFHKGSTFRLMFSNLELSDPGSCFPTACVIIFQKSPSILKKRVFELRKSHFEKWSLHLDIDLSLPTPHTPYFCLSDGRHDIINEKIRSAFFQKWEYASNIQFWGSWKGIVASLFFVFRIVYPRQKGSHTHL